MAFSLRTFIKTGLLDAVGKMADYQIILNAAGWYEKGVLTEEDLAEIQAAIDAKNTPAPDVEPDSVYAPDPVGDTGDIGPVVEPDGLQEGGEAEAAEG